MLLFAWQILREGAESLEQHLGLEALMSSGRVDNLAVVMGLHPDYLSSFWRLHYLLLHTDGPLASSWRHYIAIMVSPSELGTRRGDQMVVLASDSFGDSPELIFFFKVKRKCLALLLHGILGFEERHL